MIVTVKADPDGIRVSVQDVEGNYDHDYVPWDDVLQHIMPKIKERFEAPTHDQP